MTEGNGNAYGWLDLAVNALVGAVGAIGSLIAVAWRIQSRLSRTDEEIAALELRIERRFSEQATAFAAHIHRLGDRIGALEQDMAVLKDWRHQGGQR